MIGELGFLIQTKKKTGLGGPNWPVVGKNPRAIKNYWIVLLLVTRRYGALWAPTSSSCRGLVAYGHLEGPSGPLDSCMDSCMYSCFLFSTFDAPDLSNKLPKAETSRAGLERPITPVITAIGSAYSIELTLE